MNHWHRLGVVIIAVNPRSLAGKCACPTTGPTIVPVRVVDFVSPEMHICPLLIGLVRYIRPVQLPGIGDDSLGRIGLATFCLWAKKVPCPGVLSNAGVCP